MYKKQSKRFGTKDLENLVGKELYVMVLKDHPSGTIGEFIHRIGYPAKAYWRFGNLSNICYEDGRRVNNDVSEAFEDYIFRLDGVEKPKSKPPVLRGELVKKYDVQLKKDVPVNKRAVLYMEKTPRYKTRVDIMCL
ncbi:hypothetical protein HY837_03095 [archaeon]|nr:hypothetical protein [archaeon]